jgi:outer membrane protein
MTNTSIYAASSAYGINDMLSQEREFSGSPFYIGFTQPLFSFNWAKWYKKTSPLDYERSKEITSRPWRRLRTEQRPTSLII